MQVIRAVNHCAQDQDRLSTARCYDSRPASFDRAGSLRAKAVRGALL